jgi:GntR family transcriptional regulator, carbon starvation induced regulator
MARLSSKGVAEELDPQTGETLAGQAEAILQQAIIRSELEPDARLTLPALEERFGIGATPLREGLSRLVTKGLVTVSGNRGFRVAPISRADLADIVQTRCIVETGALRISMERADGEWEDNLVLAMHRLKRVVNRSGASILEGDQEFDAAHRLFHQAMIAGCGSVRLKELQAALYDQAYRYRRVMHAKGLDPARVIALHQALADLALGASVDAACKALEEHLHLTLEAFPVDGQL